MVLYSDHCNPIPHLSGIATFALPWQVWLQSQAESTFNLIYNPSLTLLCSPSPAPPLVVLPPLSSGQEIVILWLLTMATSSPLGWQIQRQPPMFIHWGWLEDKWDRIDALCPTAGHLQQQPLPYQLKVRNLRSHITCLVLFHSTSWSCTVKYPTFHCHMVPFENSD